MSNPSYQRKEPFVITDRIRRQIAGAVAEIDLQQMAIIAKLTPAERVQMAASMIDACERAGVIRLREREPELRECLKSNGCQARGGVSCSCEQATIPNRFD